MMKNKKIQFILKHRDNKFDCDPEYTNTKLSSGLFNSARFVQEMLRDVLEYETEIVHAEDNNSIDRLVTKFKPDIVIIEAYWVVPEKFEILHKLHPKVTWIIRNHSAMPFAATEGIIMDWSLRYMDMKNVILACNDVRTDREFKKLIKIYKPDWDEENINQRCIHLPNYYPIHYNPHSNRQKEESIDIGCFGAIRPLKNQLIQAVAAIEYADSIGKHLRFHINGTRIEGRGDAIINNIRALFKLIPHELVEHPWMPHEKFMELVRQMDIGLQVSYTETFNIVSADMIMNGVPVIVSPDIKWVSSLFYADPNESVNIVKALSRAEHINRFFNFLHKYFHITHPNIKALHRYNKNSIKNWGRVIEGNISIL